MVKEKPGKDEMGIYVFSTKKNIDELVAILKCCKVVHNFDSEAEPWLYMEEDSGFFYSDIDKLAAWIKSIK